MKARIATMLLGAALVTGCPAASAQSPRPTQYGTPGEYQWLRETMRDPKKRAETVARCQVHVATATNIDVLAKRTGIAEETLRQTFCRRYYEGLASGRISLNEFLHQDKPTQNYIRVLQGQ